MRKDPLVSIIIPCWNVERFVRRAINSALSQDYRQIEIIAVNDGSTDGTLDVLRSFGDRIIVLSGPNRGLSVARNVGIFAARGKLVQFLDADDELYESKISSGARHIENCAGQKILLACPGMMQLTNGNIVDRPCNHLAGDDSMISLLLGQPVQIAAFLFRRQDLIDVGGFNDGYCEDFDLYARFCALGYRFECIQEVGYRIHQVEGSMSSIGYGFLSHRPIAYRRAVNLARDRGTWTPDRAAALAYRLLRDATLLFRYVGDRRTAISNIRWARATSKTGCERYLDQERKWCKAVTTVLGYELGLQAIEYARKHLRLEPVATAFGLSRT